MIYIRFFIVPYKEGRDFGRLEPEQNKFEIVTDEG